MNFCKWYYCYSYEVFSALVGAIPRRGGCPPIPIRVNPIGVNLRPNLVPVCCLRIRVRSPLTPLSKGGTGSVLKVPLFKRDNGGARPLLKPRFIKSFILDTNGFTHAPTVASLFVNGITLILKSRSRC